MPPRPPAAPTAPAPFDDDAVRRHIQSPRFLDRLADLERVLQDRQAAGGPMPTVAEIASVLELPVELIEVVLPQVLIDVHLAAGGVVLLLDGPLAPPPKSSAH